MKLPQSLPVCLLVVHRQADHVTDRPMDRSTWRPKVIEEWENFIQGHQSLILGPDVVGDQFFKIVFVALQNNSFKNLVYQLFMKGK